MKFQKAKPSTGHLQKNIVNRKAPNRKASLEFTRTAGLLLACLLALFFGPQAHPAENKNSQIEILIAREQVDDPFFRHSVVVMLPETESQMVVGLIINKPTRLTLGKLFPDSPQLESRTERAYFGGPVDVSTPSVAFRSEKEPDNTVRLYGDVYLTFDANQISSALQSPKPGGGPRVFLGRAQWAPGQLENEIRMGGWYRIKAEGDVIFSSDPDNLWPKLHARAAPSKYIRYQPPSGGPLPFTRNAAAM
jgi:putative transcriptional regulator